MLPLPAHLTVTADLSVTCAGCAERYDLSRLDESEAERQLGSIARHHRDHGPRAAPRRREKVKKLTIPGLGL